MLTLRQDFDADFDQLTAGLAPGYQGEPYAFVRFGDGEAAIMRGKEHVAKSDGWKAPAGDLTPNHWRLVGGRLVEMLWDKMLGFYVGISAHEHHPECHRWLFHNSKGEVSKITYAEIFIFANYSRWLKLGLWNNCINIGPYGDEPDPLSIPRDAMMTGWDHRPTVDFLIENAFSPILVAAGPLANVIIHDYWLRCPESRKQTILDVGSAISHLFKGRRIIRSYQKPGNPQAEWKPRFWPE